MPSSASSSVSTMRAAGQHVERAARALDGFFAPQHVGPARRHQHQVVEAHGLHGARGGADIAGMAGLDQDETGAHGGWRRKAAGPVKSRFSPPASPGRLLRAPAAAVLHTIHVVPQPAPHAQRGRQGRSRRRRHHQPRRARRRSRAHLAEAGQRLRHRSRSRERSSHHRNAARAPTRGTASSPKNRAREHGAKDSDYVWIIDPLDGTTNFIHGFPVYCVSIALVDQGQGRAGRHLRPEPQRPLHRHQGPRRLHERAPHPRVQAHAAAANA